MYTRGLALVPFKDRQNSSRAATIAALAEGIKLMMGCSIEIPSAAFY